MAYSSRKLLIFLVLTSMGVLSCVSAPNCATCNKDKQWWRNFSFMDLEGTWRGTKTIVYKKNEGAFPPPKKIEVELSFLSGDKFLHLYEITAEKCNSFPKESIVMLHNVLPSADILASGKKGKQPLHTFEVLGRTRRDYISFGKVYIHKGDLKEITYSCEYVKLGEFHQNRLKLPSLTYSFVTKERNTRTIAHSEKEIHIQPFAKETDVYFDFFYLREERNRNPAQVQKEDGPPVLLFETVFSSYILSENFGKNKWIATEKRVFKLWPVDE